MSRHRRGNGGRCRDGSLKAWDVRTDACVLSSETAAPTTALLRLADGAIASGHSDGCMRVWDVRGGAGAGAAAATLSGHEAGHVMFGLAQLPDGRVCSASRDATVRVWSLATRTCVGVVASAPAPLHRSCVTADGRLAVACGDGTARVHVVDAATATATAAATTAAAAAAE